MKKIITIFMIILFAEIVNSCKQDYTQEPENYAISLWNEVHDNNGYCQEYVNSTIGFMECCLDYPKDGYDYAYLFGTEYIFLTPDFYIRFENISYTTYGASTTYRWWGITNITDIDSPTYGIIYADLEDFNRILDLRCGTTSLDSLSMEPPGFYNLTFYSDVQAKKIYGQINDRSVYSCNYNGDITTLYVPFFGINSSSVGGSEYLCTRFNTIIVNNSVTTNGYYHVKDAITNMPIENCTIINTLPLIGVPPYYTPDVVMTISLGITENIEYNPSCVWNSETGFESYGEWEMYCDNPNYQEIYNGLYYTSSFLESNPTYIYLTSEESGCKQPVIVKYANGTFINDAIVTSIGVDEKEYNSAYIGSGLYDFIYPCQNYDLYAMKAGFSQKKRYVENYYPNEFFPIYITMLPDETLQTKNIQVNVTNYGSLYMDINNVEIWECDNSQQCKEVSYEQCHLLTEGDTDDYGDIIFNQITFNKDVLCVRSVYDTVYEYIEQFNSQNLGSEQNIYVTFDYGQSYLGGYCIKFTDCISQEEIPETNFILKQSGLIKQENTTNTLPNTEFCFNTTEQNPNYVLYATKESYHSIISLDVTLSNLETNSFCMQPFTIPESNKSNITGYTIYNNAILANIPTKLTCNGNTIYKTSNSAGLFNYTGIILNSQCVLSDNTGEYDSNSISFTNTGNREINITLTLHTGYDIRTVQFTILDKDTYSYTQSIENAKVELSYQSLDTKTCYTNDNGICSIDNLEMNIPYNVKITANNYEEKTYTLDDDDTQVQYLTPLYLNKCQIKGYVYLQNNTNSPKYPLIADVYQMALSDGGIIEYYHTNTDGMYIFNVECGFTYNFKAVYNYKELNTYLGTKPNEGDILLYDFIFKTGEITKKEKTEDIIDFIWQFTDLFKILFLLVILGLITLAANSIGGYPKNRIR